MNHLWPCNLLNSITELPTPTIQLIIHPEHFEMAMQHTGYLQPELRQQTAVKMNRFLSKADVSLSELNMLRGFLSSVLKNGR